MRTTVNAGQGASIPMGAHVCRPTDLRRHSPHARTAVLLAILVMATTAGLHLVTTTPSRPTIRAAGTNRRDQDPRTPGA
jgi:4-hydroxybenzoate polyprenyltransferase